MCTSFNSLFFFPKYFNSSCLFFQTSNSVVVDWCVIFNSTGLQNGGSTFGNLERKDSTFFTFFGFLCLESRSRLVSRDGECGDSRIVALHELTWEYF